ncbi:hydroxymethylbilane synthase [Clavibacter californiensis]|uniref:Porphobilinogen deaminase n=1 Tax=Clavibacter californiensis TaxID=1401995 RepID=A0ABX9N8G6_9MICO|nr:hydroxymethylbilane synthase [Clavibacter californiensis]PPF59917.1 hydroxymethylbilane synthase [Clavibacter michiganensis]RII92112.1 hydroxymethylbilane synthase [Clavibacter californiensis]UKF81024.1 hydroxymethylbilane synthase [Clavibacter californiensis]
MTDGPTTSAPTTTLRIGTRGSALALAQTRAIAAEITDASGLEVELVPVTTHGDTSRESLSSLGGTGVFASALRESLLRGECDLVVHSLKDLPTTPYAGLTVASVPAREDPRDVLCARDGLTLATLPRGARVGTGSPRRRAQILAERPDLDVVDIRGNIDTRLSRVTAGDLDAVVLAAAGLERIGRIDAATEHLELDRWPTAPGQGALALEIRTEDAETHSVVGRAVEAVDDPFTHAAVLAERGVLAALEAGCAAPIGAWATVTSARLALTAVVYRPDGTQRMAASHELDTAGLDLAQLGASASALSGPVSRELLDAGAADLAPLGGTR